MKRTILISLVLILVLNMISCMSAIGGIEGEKTHIGTWILDDWWSTDPLDPTEDKNNPRYMAIRRKVIFNEDGTGSVITDHGKPLGDYETDIEWKIGEQDNEGIYIVTTDPLYEIFYYSIPDDSIRCIYSLDDDIVLAYRRN